MALYLEVDKVTHVSKVIKNEYRLKLKGVDLTGLDPLRSLIWQVYDDVIHPCQTVGKSDLCGRYLKGLYTPYTMYKLV